MVELAKDAGLPMPTMLNPEDTIFEYVVNEKGQWEHWADRVCSLTSLYRCFMRT